MPLIEVIHLPAGGWDVLEQPSRDRIAKASAVFHSDPFSPTFEELKARGIDVHPVPPEGFSGDAILVIPAPQQGPIYELVAIVDRLLGPGGCPWDQAQTHESLKRYLLEEAYEVLDAIDSGSDDKLREELGDLLLQPILHAQKKREAGSFDSDAVAREICDKLIRRHPHVFGDISVADADEVLRNWDRIKSEEKGAEAPASRLAGVPSGMASLLRAYEVSKRAVRAGFEWPDIDSVFEKLREEENELREALAGGDAAKIESEVGDLLFTVVNISRWARVEPEEALRKMLNRFTARFQRMEQLSTGKLEDLSIAEWDALWVRAKAEVG